MAKTPVGEKAEGIETAGRAKVPPMVGPMIVPIDHTNGITAYARAVKHQLNAPFAVFSLGLLRFVCNWVGL